MKKIHFYIITSQGGIADGVRPPQEGNIIAAVERPKTKVIGENPSGLPVEAFDNLLAKATALGFGLNRGHGFTDGNKRTSFMAMVLMLYVNGANMIVPPAMTKYHHMVADNKISEKEFLGVVKRLAYSNRIIGVW